jgi:3-deoxy-D-manno-octulosonic-acid transferase
VQDNHSLTLLKSLNIESGIVCGDTRIDRVLQIKNEVKSFTSLENFSNNNFVIIAGSSWPNDEAILIPVFAELKKLDKKMKLILAPHETERNHILLIEKLLNEYSLTYSLYTKTNDITETDVFVIDTIGILSAAYRYGKVAYIGGGFDNGIHNILEPAVYGLPILFGTNHKKFIEAQQLLISGGAFEIRDKKSLHNAFMNLINDQNSFAKASLKASEYVQNAKGASQKIINGIFNLVK